MMAFRSKLRKEMKGNVLDVLEERGFIESTTSDQLNKILSEPVRLYIGFDPTAYSLHIGNLVGIIALGWFQKFGHQGVALVGGATGFIGDPTGKSAERPLLTEEEILKNSEGIQKDLQKILSHTSDKPIEFVNNIDWFKGFGALDFLREVAGSFRMGPLLSRETVRERLKTQEGMSVKEFCYPLIQGYDFLKLNQEHQVSLQIGGSDQWTNITAGIELVRKKQQKEVYGLTFPLLLKSDGKKFGKSEGGAVWLSKDKLSVYDFYQYFIRVADEDVITLLKRLTYLEMSEIQTLENSMKAKDYVPNTVQKILAAEVTKIVHGQQELETALKVTEGMKPGSKTELDLALLKKMAEEIPSKTLRSSAMIGQKVIDLLASSQILPSKGEVRRMLQSGGIYLNNLRIEDEQKVINTEDLIEGECLLFAIGKKKKVLIFLEK